MKLQKAKVALALSVAASVLGVTHFANAQTVPHDAVGGCPIAPSTVAGFFQTPNPSAPQPLNGVVKAADSTVSLAPNCGFFQWSEQMFLWMTSPAPAIYGGGSRIMFSPKFFTVTPEDSSGRRSFIQNSPGLPIRMLLRATELGPHGLPALLAKSGHVIEVQKAPALTNAPAQIRLQSGAMVRLSDVVRAPNGQLRFLDLKGKAVTPARLNLPMIKRPMVLVAPGHAVPVVPVQAFQNAIQARKLIFHGVPIFIDPAGNVIDTEQGQADGGVLISQGNSLIYYITVVNDVFAYHRTMQGSALIPFNTTLNFPMTAGDASAVAAFAAMKGHTINEPNALAVESKSSWIEASAVPDPNDYVRVQAVVPTFDKSNPNLWVPNGQQTLDLVMIGMHVVGSTNGHGEMVWATFEHQGNAPNDTYAYNSSSGPQPHVVPRNTSGSWLFTPSGSAGPFNSSNASVSGANIVGSPIGATMVLRAKPWGMSDGGNPSSIAGINTQVISANWSVLSQLNAADVRSKYFMLGTTWTPFGTPPGAGVGTNHLANATIETFMQGANVSDAGSNCFSCHTTNHVAVSHIYRELKPLP